MKVVQSYQQGAKHKTYNLPCEDRTYSLSKNGVDAIALADGAGGQKYTHSAQGAECVTKFICSFFCNNFDKLYAEKDTDEIKHVITALCQRKLTELAEKLNLDSIIRLSSTLLAVAIKGNRALICHVGDGVIGKVTVNGTMVVSGPENGEYASTTYFIAYPDAEKHMFVKKESAADAISYFLMSDGASEYVYNDQDGTFFAAAQKMAMLANEEDGQQKLYSAIRDHMINKDDGSDDCSFISVVINDRPIVESDKSHESGELPKIPDNPISDPIPSGKLSIAKTVFIALIVASFILGIALGLGLGNIINSKDNKDVTDDITSDYYTSENYFHSFENDEFDSKTTSESEESYPEEESKTSQNESEHRYNDITTTSDVDTTGTTSTTNKVTTSSTTEKTTSSTTVRNSDDKTSGEETTRSGKSNRKSSTKSGSGEKNDTNKTTTSVSNDQTKEDVTVTAAG